MIKSVEDVRRITQSVGTIVAGQNEQVTISDVRHHFEAIAERNELWRREIDRLKLSENRESDGTSRRPIFFLDAWYTVFTDISAEDCVLVSELSPLFLQEIYPAFVSEAFHLCLTRILRKRARLVATSKFIADCLYANFGIGREGIKIVGPYIHHAHHYGNQTGDGDLEGVYPIHPYFLYVGGRGPLNNVAGAIKAFAASRLGGRGYELLVVGNDVSETDEVIRLAHETSGVRFCDVMSDGELDRLYASATGFVHCSYLAAEVRSLQRALSFGIPCAAVRGGAVGEFADAGVFYAGIDDYPALGQIMADIAGLRPDERRSVGHFSRSWMSTTFSIDRLRADIKGVFEELLL